MEEGEVIYFIESGNSGAVKIGYTSKDPLGRVGELQTGNPEKLRPLIILSGKKSDERWLHKRFRDYLIRGEWYSYYGILKETVEVCAYLSQAHIKPSDVLPALHNLKYDMNLSQATVDVVKYMVCRGMLHKPWLEPE